ncbi:MAG TPA: sortase [Candidatus Dojkabacteria bacterium]|nr:sortase [Candidatus Dojkabacteria bacterium]
MTNEWNVPTKNEKKTKNVQLWISGILAFIGLVIVSTQLIPLTGSFLDGLIEKLRTEFKIKPVPDSYKQYIEEQFAYYDPGKSYFANLAEQIGDIEIANQYSYDPESGTQKEITVDTKYDKDMYISISSIGIKDIKISPNVESSDEKIYNKYLKSGVAHFKGTPLPGDGGNSFIYGHSAVDSFFRNHKNLPETIFSRLNSIDIGQDVVITKDKETFTYVVRNKKIVAPDDFSILRTQNNKETVTLMTCWPLGIGTKRLVVVAEREI